MSEKVFDILVVGSGLSSLVFAEEYLKKKIILILYLLILNIK